MTLEGLKSQLGFGSDTPTSVPEESEEETTEPNTSESEDASTGISRPPGWGPIYGTYDKPVFPTDDRRLMDLLEAIDRASDITNFKTHLPPMGTNMEHIEMYVYTVGPKSGERTLVMDLYLHEFSEWLPEEKGRYEYPEETLGNNGPYYMQLAHDLRDVFRVGPFAFTFVEYDEEKDCAIYSAERDLMLIEKLDEY